MIRMRYLVLAWGVAPVLAGLIACGAPSSESTHPPEADLAFVSNRDGNSEIYVRDAATEQWTNLTQHEGSDNWPEWSPDGRQIAFQSNRNGNLDIFVMNANGTDLRQLTDDPAHDYLPAWSPDGRQISFASWRKKEGEEEAVVHSYVMNADGSEQRRWIEESPGTSAGVVWHPDRDRILITRKVDGGKADLFLASVEGDVLQRLTNDDASAGAAVFSPDGQRIAFHSEGGEQSVIVVMDTGGTNRRVVVEEGQNWYPRWSPDGEWLVYTAGTEDADLDVFAIRADGSGDTFLLAGGPGREAEARWRPRS